MRRRAFVAAVGAALTAGCIASDPAATPTASPTPAGTVVADETLFSDVSYPVDLREGATLSISVDVQTGGPVVVVVRRDGADDDALRERVDTQAGFGVEIETAGVYRIHIVNVDEADVRVMWQE